MWQKVFINDWGEIKQTKIQNTTWQNKTSTIRPAGVPSIKSSSRSRTNFVYYTCQNIQDVFGGWTRVYLQMKRRQNFTNLEWKLFFGVCSNDICSSCGALKTFHLWKVAAGLFHFEQKEIFPWASATVTMEKTTSPQEGHQAHWSKTQHYHDCINAKLTQNPKGICRLLNVLSGVCRE